MGQHKNPRRLLSQSREQFEEQDKRAEAEGLTWADWVRALITIATEEEK